MAKSSGSRALVAIVLTVSGIGLFVSGMAMALIHPSGPESVSHHAEAWVHTHALLAVIFTAFAVWHIVLNWKVMLSHLGVR